MKNFVLPARWWVEHTPETGKWFTKNSGVGAYSREFVGKSPFSGLSSHNEDDQPILEPFSKRKSASFSGTRGVRISLDQFDEYVVKLTPSEQPLEDLSYIADLFETLKIC